MIAGILFPATLSHINHIKLWIFDEAVAFYGGIGIESQFRKTLYDEMDRVQGPIVGVMSIMALLLMANQRNELPTNESAQYDWITKDKLQKIFEKNRGESHRGNNSNKDFNECSWLRPPCST